MNIVQSSFIWLFGASLLGFLISAFFSARLKLSRTVFLLPYIIISSIFLYFFLRQNQLIEKGFWLHNWHWGLLVAIPVCVLLVKNVLSQPLSQKEKGVPLYRDIIWSGLAYGVTDGLFLNVMPVLTVWNIFSVSALSEHISGQILIGFLAILASLIVTLFYHLGYLEFRNKSVLKVLLGNAIITLPFVLSGNPLAAVLCHTTMHFAAVIRGPETTLQLPPHYN